MANNTSNGNKANNNANATNNANASGSKQTPAAKDSSKEQELEAMLYRLDQAHAQVGLPWQSGHHRLNAVGTFLTEMQLRRLRSALPRMLEPLKTKHPTRKSCRVGLRQPTNTNSSPGCIRGLHAIRRPHQQGGVKLPIDALCAANRGRLCQSQCQPEGESKGSQAVARY